MIIDATINTYGTFMILNNDWVVNLQTTKIYKGEPMNKIEIIKELIREKEEKLKKLEEYKVSLHHIRNVLHEVKNIYENLDKYLETKYRIEQLNHIIEKEKEKDEDDE